ncbi:hypothetical protein [Nocardioides sp. CFH 31398]|jgi:hypothetical protein|uniref:PspA-associated protein PspAB n=1 Tax=Nocardioides sp. CFH 31398 TaxID=2919579 RepID=UPI001F068C19|nr:hypothetical protein [Nocardioides sp. CFH 31398]MCH1868189.1 hypothetical protein [Nocardioides sp. CFH 31398]
MGFLDAILGRRAPRPNRLDDLFHLPNAAVTLQTAAGLEPTGVGAVCYRGAAGAAFSQTQDEIVQLLDADPNAPKVEKSVDSFGFTWLVVRRDPSDTSGLATDLHAVNTILGDQGFADGLLCSHLGFSDASGRRLAVVYLYKQGTFYPFAPTGPQSRDNLLELSVRDHLTGELPMEKDTSRWLAIWGAPGI